MIGFRFTLKQLLLAVVVAAFGLLLLRHAVRSNGVAAGVLTFMIGAVVVLLANLLIYGLLRAVGQLYGLEPDEAEDPAIRSSPPPMPAKTEAMDGSTPQT